MRKSILAFTAVFLFLFAQSQSMAGVITAPVSVIQNTLGEQSIVPFSQTFDQSGLSIGYTSGVTDTATFIASSPTHLIGGSSNVWLSNVTTGVIDLDLGSDRVIEVLLMWDIGPFNPSDVQLFTVLTSSVSDFSSSTNVGSFSMNPVDVGGLRPLQQFDLADSTARYVRLQIDSNYGSSSTGLGEFALSTTAAVPEPSSFILLATGMLCLLGYSRRRKNRGVVVAT